MTYRTSNFKLEQIHGKAPDSTSGEALLRNYIFGVRLLRINHTQNKKTYIRIIGYEVPIYSRGQHRDECIDLLGYDEQYQPWIVELKQEKASDSLGEVVAQVTRYAEAFDNGIGQAVQEEVRERLLWPSFSFKGKAKRMILASRTFFIGRNETPKNSKDILFCSFSRIKDEASLMNSSRDEIGLKIERLTRA
jgi:hypothetical protein